jgi:hypothetical protein
MEDNDRQVWIGAALFVAVIAAGVLIYRFASAPPPMTAAAPPPAPAPAAAPAAALPKLEESDAFVRGRAAALSPDPRFAEWLKNDDLAARLTAAANLIARGQVPADAFKFLAPRSKFPALRRGGKIFMDPRGYARYDALANAVASLDAPAAASFFRDLKPLFQQAWNSLGEKGGDVQDVFVRAVSELLRAPNLGGVVELKEGKKGIVYVFADGAVEGLSPAQKQLLRMGPKNARRVQLKLREIALALGASNTELPLVPAL